MTLYISERIPQLGTEKKVWQSVPL